MDSDVNHTVGDILLTGVDKVRRVVVQTKPFPFAERRGDGCEPGARAGRDTAAVRERRRLFGLRAGVSLAVPVAPGGGCAD